MKTLKKVLILMLVTLIAFTWTACSNDKPQEESTGEGNTTTESSDGTETIYPFTFKDTADNEITLEKTPERIVSVSASITETLFAVGLGDQIVGRDEFSNYPEETKEIEVVGNYVEPNTELIIDLEPEVLFVSSPMPEDATQLIKAAGIKTIVISDQTDVDGVLENIQLIGKIGNVQETANKLVEDLDIARKEITDKVKDTEEKKVFVDLQDFVSVGADTFIDSMLQEINAVNIAADSDTAWPTLTLEKIVDANPDVYISLYPTVEEIKGNGGLQSVAAVENDNIIYFPWGTEENDILSRSGPRVMKGLEFLAKAIHPEAF